MVNNINKSLIELNILYIKVINKKLYIISLLMFIKFNLKLLLFII